MWEGHELAQPQGLPECSLLSPVSLSLKSMPLPRRRPHGWDVPGQAGGWVVEPTRTWELIQEGGSWQGRACGEIIDVGTVFRFPKPVRCPALRGQRPQGSVGRVTNAACGQASPAGPRPGTPTGRSRRNRSLP